MLEVILDTETTGLSTAENHRIVEIGCVELDNQIPTGKIFHEYLNPQRSVSEEALKVHGYTDKFLSDKKIFSQIVDEFLNFITNKKIIIHNAVFDLSFLNYELRRIKKNEIGKVNIIDTLDLARQKYPGSHNSLDALCKRYNIDNSKRDMHSALVDCNLLKEVYINLVDQKEPKLDLVNVDIINLKINDENEGKKNISRKIIEPSNEELELHNSYLKKSLKKIFFKNIYLFIFFNIHLFKIYFFFYTNFFNTSLFK